MTFCSLVRYRAFFKWWHDTLDAHHDDVGTNQQHQHDRHQDDVPHQHLARVQEIEERPTPGGVDGVLGLGGYPLRVEVGLGYVTGQSGHDRHEEEHHARYPGHGPPPAPSGHEVLAPQVNHHGEEEDLHAPEVQRVHEVANVRNVPPLGPEYGQDAARGDDHDEGRDRGDAKDVDPRGDVAGLGVGQHLFRRKLAEAATAQAGRPLTIDFRGAHWFSLRRRRPGKGSTSATTNVTIIKAITMALAALISKKCQWK